jgi:hypothetical protein
VVAQYKNEKILVTYNPTDIVSHITGKKFYKLHVKTCCMLQADLAIPLPLALFKLRVITYFAALTKFVLN